MTQRELLIIMPARNEAENLPGVLDRMEAGGGPPAAGGAGF